MSKTSKILQKKVKINKTLHLPILSNVGLNERDVNGLLSCITGVVYTVHQIPKVNKDYVKAIPTHDTRSIIKFQIRPLTFKKSNKARIEWDSSLTPHPKHKFTSRLCPWSHTGYIIDKAQHAHWQLIKQSQVKFGTGLGEMEWTVGSFNSL